jgi:hypothetical protein
MTPTTTTQRKTQSKFATDPGRLQLSSKVLFFLLSQTAITSRNTMLHCRPVAAVLAVTFSVVCLANLPGHAAFVVPPPTLSRHGLAFCPNILVDNNPQPTSSLALNMGLVKDFIVETDAKTRKADNEKYLKQLQQRVDKINALEATIEELDDEELQAKTDEFRARLKQGEDINGRVLEEAFAVVREAAW